MTMDMWRPYVARTLPHATIVVDKFHVLRMANKALDSVRKQLRNTLSTKERRTLMHDRFLLLKRATDLTAMEQLVLEAWTKETVFTVYDTLERQEAEDRYRQWVAALPGDLHVAFGPLMISMANWQREIFAYFDHPVTNAYTESANNLIREMQRMGRGYSFDVLRAKMLYTAGIQ